MAVFDPGSGNVEVKRQGDKVNQEENKTEQVVCSVLFQAPCACISHCII
jgi:hypothetical protein